MKKMDKMFVMAVERQTAVARFVVVLRMLPVQNNVIGVNMNKNVPSLQKLLGDKIERKV